MAFLLKLVALVVLLVAPGLVLYGHYNAGSSPDAWSQAAGQSTGGGGGAGLSAAPGPVMGAGLPVLVVLAGGYWVARRLRRKTN